MSYENIFGPDSLSLEKIRIIGILERDGLSEEALTAVRKWTDEMETRSVISSIEMVRFNVDRAELYEACGDIDEMFTCLDQALNQVTREKDVAVEGGNWDQLEEIIKRKILELESKYPIQ